MYAYCSLSHIALPDIEEFAKGANALVPESVANGADNPILSQRVDGKNSICDICSAYIANSSDFLCFLQTTRT